MKRICVFCGSSFGNRPEYRQAATALGTLLAQRGLDLVYGGGNVGLMGAVADACMAAGGKVVGVIPQSLLDKEVGHHGLTELEVVDSMHTRKARMAELADGFIALPGGFGTFEELCEILTWAQLGFHAKPAALLDVAGYYAPLLQMFDQARDEGFVREVHRGLLLADTDPAALLDRMASYQAPAVVKWVEKENQL
jgi:uncharacterized protein (TIGR00730 family)